jgi:hypothetical protein
VLFAGQRLKEGTKDINFRKNCCIAGTFDQTSSYPSILGEETPMPDTKLISFALAASLASTAAFADEVRVYNWSDYIDEDLLAKFEEETGIEITYDVFDSNEILETKLLAGQSGYDVVVPSATFLQRQIQAGVFQQLDMSQLPNAENVWDVVTARTASYDPGNAYSGSVRIWAACRKFSARMRRLVLWSWCSTRPTWKSSQSAVFISLMPHPR